MTVTELSRITGYSISTVSKALSDSSEIGEKAKKEILAAAVETGYYNKALKRRKRIGAPKTVGIVCDEYSDFRLMRNLCRELEKEGFKAVICINEDGCEVCSHLGVDSILFYKTDIKDSPVPSYLFDGDIDEVIALLKNGSNSENEPQTDDFETPQKKEDIWLF